MIISQSYDYLLKEFGQDRINHRIKSLYERAIAFIKKEGLIDKVGVNSEILRVVVLDYFADIQRLKNFNSDLEHTNLHKIYAYSCYWWIRRKPIQVLNNNINNENLVYINEKFMASYLLYEMLTINNLNKYITPFIIWTNYDIKEQFIEKISANFLPSIILETANLELPAYYRFLKEVYKVFPVITTQGIIDSNGNYYSDINSVPDNSILLDY